MNVPNRYFTNYMVRYDQQLVAHTIGRSSKYFRQLKSLGGTVFQSNQMAYLPTTVTVRRPTSYTTEKSLLNRMAPGLS